jgi:hypothetical protein
MNSHGTMTERASESKVAGESKSAADSTSAAEHHWSLYRDPRRRLVLVRTEGEEVAVQPVRCFPISCAEQWISICDLNGHELLCVQDPAALKAEVRNLLEEELARHEFVPIVERILRISDDSECAEWDVQTDRGPTTFHIDSDDAVRRLEGQRVMIIDSCGTRYLIENTRALDRASNWLLDRYI